MSERDTKFAGFARLLLMEMLEQKQWGLDFNRHDDDEVEMYSALIAQRAFDLVGHTIDTLWPYINDKAVDPLATDIPDLTEWPEQ